VSVDDRRDAREVPSGLDEVTTHLATLTKALSAEDLSWALQRAVRQVADRVPGADMVSVTVLCEGRGETMASTSERVWAIDSDQYAVGEGPCLEAARTNQIVRVGVERAPDRWPVFARSAREAGVQSYLSCPLVIGAEFVGSLNLYSEQPHGFDEFDIAPLRMYLTAATTALDNSRQFAQARRLAEQLAQALDSRAVIDQASGILMAQRDITADQARELLVRYAQGSNIELRVLAAQLVDDVQHAVGDLPPDDRPAE
jgi:GAF domain-containing protein